MVKWKKVLLPKKLGGLGIIDLELFARALRVWWMWYEWSDLDRPWVGTELPCDNTDRQVFRISTIVSVGDGKTAKF